MIRVTAQRRGTKVWLLRSSGRSRRIAWFLAIAVGLASGAAPADAQERWRLQEQLRIGAVDGPEALSRVGDLVTSIDGRLLFVAQPQEYGVRVLDARTGALIRTIGRRGGGPGEFSRVGALSVRGDSLFAEDAFAQRMVVLSAEGEDLGTFQIHSDYFLETRARPLFPAATPSGGLWTTSALAPATVDRGGVTRLPIAILGRNGDLVRRVASIPIEGAATVAEFQGGIVMFIQPFLNPHGLYGFAPDGSSAVVVELPDDGSERHRFTVHRISHTGDTIFSRPYRFEPQPVTPAQRDSLLDRFATTMFERVGGRARSEAERHVRIPDFQRPVSEVLVDAAGRTWIRRETLRPRPRWLVLDAEGRLDGVVETPLGVELEHVAGDTAWAVVRDEMDVPYIVKYQVERPREES